MPRGPRGEKRPADVIGMVLVDGSHEEDTGNINGKMITAFALSKGRPIPPPRSSVTAADALDEVIRIPSQAGQE